MSAFEDFMMFLREECNKKEAKKHPSDNKADKNDCNEQKVQGKGALTADGKLIPASGIDVLMTIFFEIPHKKMKTLNNYPFAERIVRNFINSNTKKDIDDFITYKTISKIIDVIK